MLLRKMWSPTLLGAGCITGGVAAVYLRRRSAALGGSASARLSRRLHKARTVDDLVAVLRSVAQAAQTEQMVDELASCLLEHGVDESFLVRISRLHRQFGRDIGARGYAVGTVWSVLLVALGQGAIIYCP